jgi:Putative transposase
VSFGSRKRPPEPKRRRSRVVTIHAPVFGDFAERRRAAPKLMGSDKSTRQPRFGAAATAAMLGVGLEVGEHSLEQSIARGSSAQPCALDLEHIVHPSSRRLGHAVFALEYRFKRPWADGTHAIVLSPHDFIARLCAMIPATRLHLLRYHGVLAPNSKTRPHIVPGPTPIEAPPVCAARRQLELALPDHAQAKPKKSSRHAHIQLLRHAFAIDLKACPNCGGEMRVRELVLRKRRIANVRARHAPARAPPPRVPRRDPRQLAFRF